jgi:ADP-heptose:LPS heptosyltransferase
MKKAVFIIIIFITWIFYPILNLISKKKINNIKQKRLLFIPQYSRIGDIVCSTPVVYNIKEYYPDSYIVALISKKALGILKNNTRIDKIILLEDYTTWGLIKALRKENFNWSINLSATSINTCIALWSLIPNRIKTVVETPPITEKLTDWMSNYKLLYKNHTFLPQHHINLLKFLNINDPKLTKEVFTTPETEVKAESWRKSIPDNLKIIGISISAGNKIKELGDDKFEILIKKILQDNNNHVVIIGSKADKPRIDSLVGRINNTRCTEATNFNLEELPSLMKRFDLYIAVDTGPIYIAHTLGIKLIDIIGPVDPNEQPPNDSRSIQVLARNNIKPSSFVFKSRGTQEQIKSALDNTYVDDIYEVVIKLLT